MNNPHQPDNLDRSVEIYAIGNELLVGQVLDTNTHWLIKSLTAIGAHVQRAAMLRDDYTQIGEALQAAVRRGPRLILTTGGLGPTDDDLTLRAIAQAFDRPMSLHPVAVEWVRQRYAYIATIRENFDPSMTPARTKMAFFPEGSTPIPNPDGAAPAMLLELGHTAIVSLPGVPSEMKRIFSDTLQPALAATVGAGGYIERMIVLDRGDESRIAPVLQLVQERHPSVYLKSRGQVLDDGPRLTVMVSCGGSDLSGIKLAVLSTETDVIEGLAGLGYGVLRIVGEL
jgi:nicotinamide-nucleotide amidase